MSDEDDISFFMRQPRRARSASSASSASSAYTSDSASRSDAHAISRSRASLGATLDGKLKASTLQSDLPLVVDDDNDDDGYTRTRHASATGASRKVKTKAKAEEAAKRRRSPSVTPPPEIPEVQLRAARQLVRRHLASYHPTHALSSDEDEPGPTHAAHHGSDLLQLDPELARYYRGKDAEQIRQRAKQEEEERFQRRKRQLSRRSESVVSAVPDDDEVVLVQDAPKPQKNIPSGAHQVIVLSDSDDDLSPRTRTGSTATAKTEPQPPTHSQPEPEGATLHLHLKSASLPTFDVAVRPTTQISRILNHFQNSHEQLRGKEVKMVFEGEVLHPARTVEECELEDEDLVDVCW
ncbi:hypothetical protein ACQY0O_004028 [Thecaphora frezii]